MRRLKLTVASIKKDCQPPRPDETTASGKPLRELVYWDSVEAGLGLRVRPPRNGSSINATFILQRDVNGRPVKVTIGRFGAWTPDQARKRAKELVVEMDQGIDPREEKRQARARGATLLEARNWHLDAMRARGCAQRSMDDVRQESERHLADWLARSLAEITTEDCVARHRRVSRRGSYVANRVMRHLRAIWKTADNRVDLPRCPVRAVAFNKERRRREPIKWDALPDWWRTVQAIENPVVRSLQVFLLLTGLRKTDGRTVRWDDVDLDAGTIHRPRPKGGAGQAFTVPVSSFVLALLQNRRAENRELFPEGDGGWVFPARNRRRQVVHVYEARVMRYRDGERLPTSLPSPHRLRDTFATAGHEARLHPLDLKVLMNHRLPAGGDVTEGYIRPSVGHLRDAAERVAAFLLTKAGVSKPRIRATSSPRIGV